MATDPTGGAGYAFGEKLPSADMTEIVSWADEINSLANARFNVKSQPYNAAGNGVTDDTTAIQAALDDAAASSSATVVFPLGTYRVTAPLVVTAGTNLLGTGPGGTIIAIDHATNDLIQYDELAVHGSAITDLTLRAAQTNAGFLVRLDAVGTTEDHHLFDNVQFDATNCTGSAIRSSVASTERYVVINDCKFTLNAACEVINDTSGTYYTLNHCYVRTATSPTANVILSPFVTANACFFDMRPSTSGTFNVFRATSIPLYTITGCTFASGSATVTCISVLDPLGANAYINETGNVFGAGLTLYSIAPTTAVYPQICNLQGRKGRTQRITSDSASLTVDTLNYEAIVIIRTSNTAMTATLSAAPHGTEFWLVYAANGSAGATAALTVTATGATCQGTAGVGNGFIPADTSDRTFVMHAKSVSINSTYWSCNQHSAGWINA